VLAVVVVVIVVVVNAVVVAEKSSTGLSLEMSFCPGGLSCCHEAALLASSSGLLKSLRSCISRIFLASMRIQRGHLSGT